jgi:hypothetical protein
MAQISVKTNRVLTIAAIKDALKRIPADNKKYEEDKKQYEKDMKAWTESLDYSPSNIKRADVQLNNEGEVYRHSVTLKKYPANKPKYPKLPRFHGHSQHYAIDELKRVQAMLELSTQEDVLQSVSNRIADYIY